MILNNDIQYSASDGISIFTSGSGLPHKIQDNKIHFNGNINEQNYGIKVYRSLVEMQNNYIYGSRYGLACLDYSEESLIGNSNANNPSETQRIINNTQNQVYSFPNSFPFRFKWNAIYNDFGNDPLVYFDCPYIPSIPFLDVSNNYWGNNFIPENDLYPYLAYIYLPLWDLGEGGLKSIQDDESLFYQAQQDLADSNYASAKGKFKQIITEYPESNYLKPSVKELVALEEIYNNNFASLKAYLTSMPNLHSNDDINKFSEYFENWCDIKNEDYENAIDWFENVIENSDTPEDSIFAVIDIGYTYSLMDTLNNRFTGKYPELKPLSRTKYIENREILIDKLFHLNADSYIEKPNENEHSIYDVEILPIFGDVNLNIKFSLQITSHISIELYNLLGQKITNVFDGYLFPGTQSFKMNTQSLKRGIYIISINSNSIEVYRNKVLIVNN